MTDWLNHVALASSPSDGNVNLIPAPTSIDGVALASLNGGTGPVSGVTRFLLKHQSDSSQNTTYVWVAGRLAVPPRPAHLSPAGDTMGPRVTVRVDQGVLNAKSEWALVDATNNYWAPQSAVVNVMDFGARGDTQTNPTAITTAASQTLTVAANASFVKTDVGKHIMVTGAGPSGSDLVTTIQAVTDGAIVTLALPAIVAPPVTTVVWGSDDTSAINSAVSAAAAPLDNFRAGGGAVLLPPGTYTVAGVLSIPSNVRLEFAENAILAPMQQAVQINGRIEAHPMQQVFGGTGVMGGLVHSAGSGPNVSASGTTNLWPLFQVRISTGGPLGSADFQYSTDGGKSWAPAVSTPAAAPYAYSIANLGVTLTFGAGGAYSTSDLYVWKAFQTTPGTLGAPAIQLSGNPLANFFQISLLVTASGSNANLAFQYTLDTASTYNATTSASGTYTIPGTGITLNFAAGAYSPSQTYTFVTAAAIAITPNAFDRPSIRSWGAFGDGRDDSNAMQTAVNACLSGMFGALYVAPGVYVISQTIIMDPLAFNSANSGFLLVGDQGIEVPGRTAFLWHGAAGGVMFTLSNCSQSRIQDINFNGLSGALNCLQLNPDSNDVLFQNCTFATQYFLPVPASQAGSKGYWRGSTVYNAGDIVTGPCNFANGSSLAGYGALSVSDNGFIFKAQNAGTSAAWGPTTPGFDTIIGSTTTDNPGPNQIVWTCIGPSPACVTVGDATGTQVSEIRFENCNFTGPLDPYGPAALGPGPQGGSAPQGVISGLRVQGANNVGDIYVNQCEFAYLGRGIDARGNGFLMSIQFYTGANNQECDIFLSDSNTVINGLASQGSSRMVSGGSPASSCMINAAWWAGNYTPEIDSSYPVVVYEGSLVMTGCNLQTTKITDINSFASPDVMLGACQVEHDQFGFTTSFVSIGNTYGNAIQFNALSPSGGDDNYVNGRPTSNATFQSQNCRIFSVGDVGLPIGAPPSTNFAPYFGSNIQVGPQQLPMQSGATPVPPAGVIVKNAGSLIGSVAKFTIPASALTSSSPMTLTLCAPWNKTKIKAVYADVTSPFAGGGANTATLQVGKTVGGTATPGSYLGGTIGLNLVSGSLGAQPYGSNAGDLGPDLSTPVQGGALVWGATSGVPGTQQWSLTASFSWTGSLSPSGSVDLYVVYEVFPGWDLT